VSTAGTGKKQVPIRRGRFKVPDEPGAKPYLIGSKCGNCGKYFSPRRLVCLNCGKQQMEEVALSGKGEIYTFTIVHQQLPFALVEVPYAIVIVLLEEGCQTHGVITENLDDIEVGKHVETYFEKAKEDEEGNDLIVDKFRLVN
jgi:uncharacterized OB-fold protein